MRIVVLTPGTGCAGTPARYRGGHSEKSLLVQERVVLKYVKKINEDCTALTINASHSRQGDRILQRLALASCGVLYQSRFYKVRSVLCVYS